MRLRDYFRASSPCARPRRMQLVLLGTAAAVKEGMEKARRDAMCAGSKSSTSFYPPGDDPEWQNNISLITRISKSCSIAFNRRDSLLLSPAGI